MESGALHILYGTPPRALVNIPASVIQVSPLIPGSARLEEFPDHSLASATLYAPPGTIERRYLLAQTLRTLATGASLTALALKDKGGSRIAAELEAFGCTVTDESRAHHRIVTTSCPADLRQIEETLAEGDLRHYPAHTLFTQPGVFSWDRIDEGSALLLTHLPAFSGHGADLGCGIGVLARAVLASPSIASLTLVDIDRRALDAAAKNTTDNRCRYHWVDLRTTDLPLSNLDFVVMNPPFHDAGIEDKTLGQTFITRAAAMLKPGGQLWLTANRHLPYEAVLAEHFTRTTLIDDANGFKIFMAEK